GPDRAPRTPFQAAATLILVAVWSGCVGEPMARFWLAARDRPAVQRARLHALVGGYAALIAILVFAGVGTGVRNPIAQLVTQAVALISAPLLYVAFAPPGWLRREWRESEEVAYRQAVKDLLLFSPTRRKLAETALEWTLRLVGAESGFIAEPDGAVLGARGMDERRAERLLGQLRPADSASLVPLPEREPESAIVVPLPLSSGSGVMVVMSGPFTPFFGTDEVDRLALYAANVTAGLDRAVLTERIAALERTKTEFLNLASHELRGPITVLRGYLSMLERGSLGVIPEEARQALPVLTAKADEMNALVEQMMEAARLEEGKLELARHRTDLREVARRAVEMARPFASSAHPLVLESPDTEVSVVVDPDRIGTVIGNLLSNAIKYSPEGGEVSCRVTLEHDVAKIIVRDHGLGIPSDRIDRLFTRFGRIVTPETSHIPGTGLGLYLSRELARLHGGDLTATSIQGKGSTFVLAVPIQEEEAT
ncbi:MAG: HAMP domain-containing histidine kinase, partial [Candidatus Dormibacteraeota bacterium]|nr:HAMP domain-containing histidine kinase [Candidatus Dormibacteraeota bacterium]